jgi:hypothetical protein
MWQDCFFLVNLLAFLEQFIGWLSWIDHTIDYSSERLKSLVRVFKKFMFQQSISASTAEKRPIHIVNAPKVTYPHDLWQIAS